MPKNKWQAAYVILPYCTMEDMEALNLNNFNQVRDSLEDIPYTDHKIGMLFVQNDSIKSYSIIGRAVDFRSIGDRLEDLPDIENFSKNDCKNLYMKTTNGRINLYLDHGPTPKVEH